MEMKPIKDVPKNKWVLACDEHMARFCVIRVNPVYGANNGYETCSGKVIHRDTIAYFADILKSFKKPLRVLSYKEAIQEMLNGNGVIWSEEEHITYYFRDLQVFTSQFDEDCTFILKD